MGLCLLQLWTGLPIIIIFTTSESQPTIRSPMVLLKRLIELLGMVWSRCAWEI